MFASKLKCCLLHATRDAGEILRSRFGRLVRARRKENRASIVSAADLAAEREIIRRLRREFPAHGIIAEESGHQAGTDVFTWVIDPLDGTSNFVAGLPWFGVQIAVFHHQQPVLAALHLPMDGTLYVAEAGHGTFRNGQPVHVSTARKPADVLCAFGMDATGSRRQLLADARLLTRVAGAVRNVRATNSLVDFCCTADGRLTEQFLNVVGGLHFQMTKILIAGLDQLLNGTILRARRPRGQHRQRFGLDGKGS